MRLLNTGNVPELEEFTGGDSSIPPYAILSHTWGDQEVTLQHLNDPTAYIQKNGFKKIQKTCAMAAQHGFKYAWVDTCCIDKQASAELSEAINSMFCWYQNAAVCYVFLADLEPTAVLETDLQRCRWFSRGWTLQELIAPRVVEFFDSQWNRRGSKDSLLELLSRITRIPMDVLCHDTAHSGVSVACRMSWASRRSTTRVEDMTYCLLGIFDIHTSLIYGERHKAFARLQEEILRTTGDLTIFNWVNNARDPPEYSGFLADSVCYFEHCTEMQTTQEDSIYRDATITTRGIHLEASLRYLYLPGRMHQPVLDTLSTANNLAVGIYIRKVGGNRYVRWKPNLIAQFLVRETERKARWFPPADIECGDITRDTSSVQYICESIMVDRFLLSTKIPDKFPFHTTNPVLGNRNSVVRILWEVQTTLGLESIDYKTYPRSHWDMQDKLFFCANRKSHAWCAAIREFRAPSGQQDSSVPSRRIGLFAGLFFWNLKGEERPLIVLASIESLDGATVTAFEFGLDRVRFEDANKHALPLIKNTFGQHLITNDNGVDNPSVTIGDDAKATLTLRRDVSAPEDCVNPIYCLDVMIGNRLDSKPNSEQIT